MRKIPKRNRVSRESILQGIVYQVLLLSCLRPEYITQNTVIDFTLRGALLFFFAYATIKFLHNIKAHKFSSIVLLLIIALLIPTLIYHPDSEGLFFFAKTYLSTWTVVVLGEEEIINGRLRRFLYSINLFTIGMTVINLLFILHFGPNYLGNRSSFLGYDNTTLPFIFFGSIIAIATPYLLGQQHLNKTSLLAALAIITNCLAIESSNAKIAGVMLIAYLFLDILGFWNKKYVSVVFNLKTYILFSLIAFLAIVIFRAQYLFEDIITNDLHRNLTITGRTTIWDQSLALIAEHPLIGIGAEDFSERATRIGLFHAHSTYLNIALEGGIMSIVAYLNIFLKTWARIKNNRSDKAVTILSFGILIYFTISIIEFYRLSHMVYILLLLLFYSGKTKSEE